MAVDTGPKKGQFPVYKSVVSTSMLKSSTERNAMCEILPEPATRRFQRVGVVRRFLSLEKPATIAFSNPDKNHLKTNGTDRGR